MASSSRELEDSYEIVLQGFAATSTISSSLSATPSQLVEQVEMLSERWAEVRSQLVEQGSRLKKLRDARSSIVKKQRASPDHESATASLETERAQHRFQLQELERRHAVAMEKERSELLARFEQLEQLQKQQSREEKNRQRMSDTALEDLTRMTEQIDKERAAGQLARQRIRELEVELAEAHAGRVQVEVEKAKLERHLDELKNAVSNENAEKFHAMAVRHLSLLEEHESLREQLRSTVMRPDEHEGVRSIAQPRHQQQQQQQQQQQKQPNEAQTTEHDNESEVQELKQELIRLKQRETELSQRCDECNLIVNEVIMESDKARINLMTERNRLQADQQKALSDYAVKMKEKASSELKLRDQIEKLAKELDEIKRHSAPAWNRRH